MAGVKTVILDAGHGGSDPGAVYMGRKEKDDALALTLAVGEQLTRDGIRVLYTRVNDVYDTPLERPRWEMNPEPIILYPSTATRCRFPAVHPEPRFWFMRIRGFRL